MDAVMYNEILSHQLKGIMFHSDAYGVCCLNGYKRLKRSHCLQVKEETMAFMHTRCKAIEALKEIPDIPKKPQITIAHDASPNTILRLWHEWETETAGLYAKAVEAEPDCKLWKDLHQAAMAELKRISYML
ncbi:MAG: hypothetical protein MJZ99_07175 [Bacteroidales bacterium]|nr:hypothetical protein [Bacteroidales bacterium]